jgi:hypothetical protein
MLPVFGPGSLYITRTDIANGTPVNIGFAQEFSVEEDAANKELYGQSQYPLVVARGTIKTTGKVKMAVVSGLAINSAMYGQSFAAGQLILAQGEAHAVPASSPFTATVTNSASFDTDLGVVFATTGLPLQKVTSPAAIGQYSVSAGTYTFFSGDGGAAVLITYAFTSSSGGQKLTVVNQTIGSNPTFQLDYSTSLNGKPLYARFFQCIAAKLSRQAKLTDFLMPELDFAFYQNPAGNVWEISYPEVS